jgi:hypothetical protein
MCARYDGLSHKVRGNYEEKQTSPYCSAISVPSPVQHSGAEEPKRPMPRRLTFSLSLGGNRRKSWFFWKMTRKSRSPGPLLRRRKSLRALGVVEKEDKPKFLSARLRSGGGQVTAIGEKGEWGDGDEGDEVVRASTFMGRVKGKECKGKGIPAIPVLELHAGRYEKIPGRAVGPFAFQSPRERELSLPVLSFILGLEKRVLDCMIGSIGSMI